MILLGYQNINRRCMQYTQVNIRDAQLLFGPAVQSGPGWLSSLIADSVLAPGRAWVCVAMELIVHSQHRCCPASCWCARGSLCTRSSV